MLKKLFGRKSSDKDDKLMAEIMGKDGKREPAHGNAQGFTHKQATLSERIGEVDVLINGVKDHTYPLFAGRVMVGRDPGQVDLVIPELIVSKSHCTFLVSANEVILHDNGSTNGTYVHGEEIQEFTISDDVLVSLGKKGIVQLHVRLAKNQEVVSSPGDTVTG